jgi:hypothetical protein
MSVKNRDFLFLNLSGDFTSIHQRIEAEGYKCISWYISAPDVGGCGSGKGMINIADLMITVTVICVIILEVKAGR